jgi:hypothetical protein
MFMPNLGYSQLGQGYPQYPQVYPQPQQPTPQTQTVSNLVWVRNEQEAAMYPLSPNSAVMLCDQNMPVAYLKSADASGKPAMKIYDLVERKQTPSEASTPTGGNNTAYATKEELATLAGVVTDVNTLLEKMRDEIDTLKTKAPAKRQTAKEE